MPLKAFYQFPDHTAWGLWYIDESEEILKEQLNRNSIDHPEYQEINHPVKRLEWLASRLVTQQLITKAGLKFTGIYKDNCGKPFLIDMDQHLSLAHCYPYATAAISSNRPIGIDIERPREKLLKLAPRFLSDNELAKAGQDLVTLCKYWSGKEALYKIYGHKRLIFKKDIHLEPSISQEIYSGRIQNQTDRPLSYHVDYQTIDDHIIALGREI